MKYLIRAVNFLFHRGEVIICDQCHWSKYAHGWHKCAWPRSSKRKKAASLVGRPNL